MSALAPESLAASSLSVVCADLAHRLRSSLSVIGNELSTLELEGALEANAPSKRKVREISALLEQLVALSREPRPVPVQVSGLPVELLPDNDEVPTEIVLDLTQLRAVVQALSEIRKSFGIEQQVVLSTTANHSAESVQIIEWFETRKMQLPWQLPLITARYPTFLTPTEIVIVVPPQEAAV